ncbi:MAG: acyl carrier protein [bacterium]
MSKLKKIISNVLDIPEKEINDDTSPDNVESWDSFNGLMLVSELEKNYKVSFTMEEITAVKCVADIKKSLKKYNIDENEI